MKELRCSSPIILQKFVLKCRKADFFFYLRFLSGILTIHRTTSEGGGYLSLFFLPLPPTSHTHLDITRVIAAKSSLLLIAVSWTQTGCEPGSCQPRKLLATKLRAL